MALLQKWRDMAYSETANKGDLQRLWGAYFQKEKEIYAILLKNPDEEVKGTVKELADKYSVDLMTMVGFLDGINESLKGYENPIDTMAEDTVVKIEIDPEKLYYNMLDCKAEWLYTLKEWEPILTPERRKEITHEFRTSRMFVKTAEPGRNDPCPCGSGKKYKKCCMQKDKLES